MEFLIVTGLSGAGKTQAAHFLEDLGYYCVDNMPSALLQPFAEFCIASQGRFTKVALVTDVRAHESFEQLFRALDSLRALDCTFRILFLEAPESTLVRRYKETRRRHPLAEPGKTVQAALREEIALMQPVRERADYIINTQNLTLAQLHKSSAVCSPRPARQSCRSTWSPSATNTASPSTPISCWTCGFCRTLII